MYNKSIKFQSFLTESYFELENKCKEIQQNINLIDTDWDLYK